MNDIITLISNVGFPIACCVYMGWYVNKINTDSNDRLEKLQESLNNNTVAITRLCTKLGVGTENE